MRAVLYSAIDAEPITVVELDAWAWEMLRQHGRVRIAMPAPLEDGLRPVLPLILTIYAVRLHGLLEGQLLLFADNDELALRMQPTFLPGQRQALRSRIGARW